MQHYSINCHWRIFTFHSVKCKLKPQIFRACFSKTVTGSIWILLVMEAQHSTSTSQLHKVFPSPIKHSKDFKKGYGMKFHYGSWIEWALCTSGMQHATAQAEFTTTSQLYQNILISNYSTHAKYLKFNSPVLSTLWLSSSLPTLTLQSAYNITSMCTFKNSHLTTRAGWTIT